MVSHSGKKTRSDHLRTLNTPQPIQILAADGKPTALVIGHERYAAQHIQDMWIVQDEWWREEIDRQYFTVLFSDGVLRTIFRDRLANTWYEQSY